MCVWVFVSKYTGMLSYENAILILQYCKMLEHKRRHLYRYSSVLLKWRNYKCRGFTSCSLQLFLLVWLNEVWVGCNVTHFWLEEEKSVGTCKKKIPFGKLISRWENNVNIYLPHSVGQSWTVMKSDSVRTLNSSPHNFWTKSLYLVDIKASRAFWHLKDWKIDGMVNIKQGLWCMDPRLWTCKLNLNIHNIPNRSLWDFEFPKKFSWRVVRKVSSFLAYTRVVVLPLCLMLKLHSDYYWRRGLCWRSGLDFNLDGLRRTTKVPRRTISPEHELLATTRLIGSSRMPYGISGSAWRQVQLSVISRYVDFTGTQSVAVFPIYGALKFKKSTMLHAGRSRVRFPKTSLNFFQFSRTFQLHYGSGVDSASNRN
jgi:hypothetical protein